jgi:hypothetical protein
MTSDLASHLGVMRLIARAIAITSLLTAVAAITGLLLFYAGVGTPLIGGYGDLVPSVWYARVQAGTAHPNLLASFCIFAAAIIASKDADLPSRLRRCAQAALWITVMLTFSRGILAFGLAAALRGARTSHQRILTAGYAAACVLIMTLLTIWNLTLDPARPLEARINREAASSRWQAATSSLRTLHEHPLGGSGLGTSPGEYRGAPFDAHLTPLNIAATLGLPALAAFIAIMVFLWRERGQPMDLAIWSGLAGLGLDGLTQDIEDFRHFWVMIGLADARAPASSYK